MNVCWNVFKYHTLPDFTVNSCFQVAELSNLKLSLAASAQDNSLRLFTLCKPTLTQSINNRNGSHEQLILVRWKYRQVAAVITKLFCCWSLLVTSISYQSSQVYPNITSLVCHIYIGLGQDVYLSAPVCRLSANMFFKTWHTHLDVFYMLHSLGMFSW